MAQNFWTAIFACSASTIVTITLSLFTTKIKTDEELVGLVYQLTPKDKLTGVIWYKKPITLAVIVLLIATILSILFW
jgi:SSS family solute:Na+ symporter